MDSKSYFVLNIKEYLDTPAEKDLSAFKAQFQCPLNIFPPSEPTLTVHFNTYTTSQIELNKKIIKFFVY